MKFFKNIARILVGITFVFSGFVKGIDPLGSTYKFTDYFNAFHWEWATHFSLFLAVLLAFIEFMAGLALLLNHRTKQASWLALLFMTVFLPLTLYIAIADPVSDCGCFGDALVLTNWETFYKNIVISALALIVVFQRKNFRNRIPFFIQNIYIGSLIVVYFGLVAYSYYHLPIIDFRPYKIGNNINEGMEYPEDAAEAVYKTTYYYENLKNGKIKKFSDQNHPWQDTLNWKYQEHKTKLVKEGYIPPIHDFTIETPEGDNISDYFLHEKVHTFMLIVYDLQKTKSKNIAKIQDIADWALENNMYFICLTASQQDVVDQFMDANNCSFEVFFSDEVALKTIVRSNPGLMLTQQGDIIDKWHWKDIPTIDQLEIITQQQ